MYSENGTVADYHSATGLESLFGYLYLKNEKERISELFDIILHISLNGSGNCENKLDIKTAVADYAIMLAGAAVYATSVVVFTAPNDIAPGGLTGVATMLNHMFGLPIGTMVLVMNIPLFIWGAVENGISFLTKTNSRHGIRFNTYRCIYTDYDCLYGRQNFGCDIWRNT